MTERTADGRGASARPATRPVRAWDPLVRLIHWGLAACVLANAFLTDPEHDPHQVIGYVAVSLVGLRLIWGLVGPRTARFSAFPPNPLAALRHIADLAKGRRTVHLSHNPVGALMVYNLWASVIGMGVTGYMMGTPAYFGVEWVEEAHEVIYGWIMFSVALHLAGVVFDSLWTKVRLVPAMINGVKNMPAEDR